MKGNDDENLDNVKDTEETAMMVKDENKLDGQLDNHRVVEKVENIPEVSEKQIDDNLEEKASLNDMYAPKAACIDDKELFDVPGAKEAEVVGIDNDPTLPNHDLNASFAKEMQVEHYPDEESKDRNCHCNDNNKVVKIVAKNVENEMTDSKSDYNINENDDVKE